MRYSALLGYDVFATVYKCYFVPAGKRRIAGYAAQQ